jgi:hypothetical protein
VKWTAVEVDRTKSDGPDFPSKSRELGTVDGLRLVATGVELVASRAGEVVWRHRCGANPHTAHGSADRLLVLTDSLDYHPWGNLGPALLLRLDTGDRVADLRGQRGAALDGGRFLLGLQGYDTFDTWLHDRYGMELATWRTAGHYVPFADTDDVVVVEYGNRSPSVVRLLPGGEVERGHPLREQLVAEPVVLRDGTIVVLDAGVLLAVGRDLRAVVLAEVLDVEDTSRFHGRLRLDDGVVKVTVVERWRGTPLIYSTHHVRYALEPDFG